MALVAFCFSMTVGVLWEFFEFGMDRLFQMDMQKDTVVNSITSVMLDPTNSNIPVTIDGITSVQVNGQELGFGGYLDIGLYDTMEDLFVNFIGAVTFSVIGYFYIKHRGHGKLAKAFIPTITDKVDGAAPPENTTDRHKRGPRTYPKAGAFLSPLIPLPCVCGAAAPVPSGTLPPPLYRPRCPRQRWWGCSCRCPR